MLCHSQQNSQIATDAVTTEGTAKLHLQKQSNVGRALGETGKVAYHGPRGGAWAGGAHVLHVGAVLLAEADHEGRCARIAQHVARLHVQQTTFKGGHPPKAAGIASQTVVCR